MRPHADQTASDGARDSLSAAVESLGPKTRAFVARLSGCHPDAYAGIALDLASLDRGWIAVLLGYHNYAMPPLVSMLLGPRVPKYVASVVIVFLLAVGLVIAWRNRRAVQDSLRFWFTLALLLAITTITLLPGQAIYDHIILIPGILLVLRYRREFAAAGRISGRYSSPALSC